jgi:hypothetical protein
MYRGISARLFEQAAPAVVKPHGSKPSRLLRSALHVGAMVAPAADANHLADEPGLAERP